MNNFIILNFNTILTDFFKFKIPISSKVIDVKIYDLNIYSKVISSHKIILYGNYNIFFEYVIFTKNNNKRLCKSKKINFYKHITLKSPIGSLSPKNIKSSIKFLEKPKCLYNFSSYSNNYLTLNSQKFCTIFFISYLKIILYKNKKKQNTHKTLHSSLLDNEINTFSSMNIKESKKNDFDTDKISDNNTDGFLDNSNENIHPLYTNKSDSSISKNTPIPILYKNKLKKNKSSNVSLKDSLDLTSNNKIYPYNINKKSTNINENLKINNYTLLRKTKQINATSIIGKGEKDIFLSKIISLPENSSKIWKLTKLSTSAKITTLNLTSSKAFASGYVYITANYKTISTINDKSYYGKVNYIEAILPFSTDIIINTYNDIVKNTDVCQVINPCSISEKHILENPTLSSNNELLYDKINEQLILNIKIIITRDEEITIYI